MLSLMTVALIGKDGALAGLGYRGSNSRELLIEKSGHSDLDSPRGQVTLINTTG